MNLLTLADHLIGQSFNSADHLSLRKCHPESMARKSLRALSLTRHSRSFDDGIFLEAEKADCSASDWSLLNHFSCALLFEY
jgi:hypothetical protein